MRLLVACTACRRQFDATGRQVGSRFHCLCGEPVEVQPAQGHDARVVRCSSCGAPRAASEIACRHCDADFTLHEQDLDTVCPACCARVSDRAKFCHFCGVPLAVEQVAGDSTEYPCPVCGPGRTLQSRRLGQEQIAVLECDVCAGLWLGHDAVEMLTQQAARETAGWVGPTPRPASETAAAGGSSGGRAMARGSTQRGSSRYRKCIVCGGLMPQRNYGGRRKSGVIIDLCRDHGVWFDAEELRAVLAWVREGGAAEPVAETKTALGDPHGPVYSDETPFGFPTRGRRFGDLAEAVLFGLGSLFRWR